MKRYFSVFPAAFLMLGGATLSAQNFVKSFEVVGFESANDPTQFGPFDAFNFIVYDDTGVDAGNPTPDLIFFETLFPNIDIDDDDDGEPEKELFGGFYRTVSSTDGSFSDLGAIALDFPALEAEEGNNDGVFGFKRRAGTVKGTASTPLGGALAGASGTLEYEVNENFRRTTVNLTLPGGESFSSPTTTTVTGQNFALLNAWTADVSSLDSFRFETVNFQRDVDRWDGNLYIGRLIRVDEEEPQNWYDTRAFILLVDTDDADFDGLPDFTDLQTTFFPFFSDFSIGGRWFYASWMKSAVYPVANNWNYTTAMNWVYAPASQQTMDENGKKGYWFYSPEGNLKWFWTTRQDYPYVYRADDQQIMYHQKDNEGRSWLYNYSTGEWESLGQ